MRTLSFLALLLACCPSCLDAPDEPTRGSVKNKPPAYEALPLVYEGQHFSMRLPRDGDVVQAQTAEDFSFYTVNAGGTAVLDVYFRANPSVPAHPVKAEFTLGTQMRCFVDKVTYLQHCLLASSRFGPFLHVRYTGSGPSHRVADQMAVSIRLKAP